jgi:two-component system sensor histidine kinase KdpD
MTVRLSPERPPSMWKGLLFAAASVAITTGLIYALREVAPVESTGVVYLLAVTAAATIWGMRLGIVTAVASALAWNWFHIPPTGRFTITEGENWVALAILVGAAIFASALADAARGRAIEAERRRREADLLRELARGLLALRGADEARRAVSEMLKDALGLESVEVVPRPVGGDDRRVEVPLRDGDDVAGTLLVPRDTPAETLDTLGRLAAPVAALLTATASRERLEAQLVEAEALRRSDVLKTALLRAVSHDLRSPLTAISTAADGLARADPEATRELVAVIRAESQRLDRLIADLLDLSRLETGAATPKVDWVSVEDVVGTALDSVPAGDDVRLALEPDLPLVRADAVQMERALANLIDNAQRHGGGTPVTVQARRARHHLRLRVTDQGPGIPAEALERIFEPFYRDEGSATGGSGLGLAIARGFVEANGGRLWAESLPGQGASFVIELPLRAAPRRPRRPAEAATP